jgi:phosphoserine phosphatase
MSSTARRSVLVAIALVATHACRTPQYDVEVASRDPSALPSSPRESAGPLPSWNDTAAKEAILRFVERVTQEGGPDYVSPADRVAVFDNDGTLWVEQPMYTQLAFAIDRVKELAPAHPEWRRRQPFAAILAGDVAGIAMAGSQGMLELVAATHANITTDDFERLVKDWLLRARHPTLHRPYTELVYAPMLELLAYLRANGFTTYIISGGGVDFMRPWTERVYGVRRDQVVGSRIAMRYEARGGAPVVMRLPAVDHVDDGAGKPVGIAQAIGRRPVIAVGNSDGDFEMLEWTTAGEGPRLGVLVHHTDAEREWAYDRTSSVGKLSRALDAAPERGWLVVDMKTDWRRIFPDP